MSNQLEGILTKTLSSRCLQSKRKRNYNASLSLHKKAKINWLKSYLETEASLESSTSFAATNAEENANASINQVYSRAPKILALSREKTQDTDATK